MKTNLPLYNDYPIQDCVDQVNKRQAELAKAGKAPMTVHQKWTCKHCGARQTMGEANRFFAAGNCEECGQTTVIKKCNYMAILGVQL